MEHALNNDEFGLAALMRCPSPVELRPLPTSCFYASLDLCSREGHERDASGPSGLHDPAGVSMVSGVSVW
jgi:hypothetical protein